MSWQPSYRGHARKPRNPRPITITWACGHQTKSPERDPVARRELRGLAKREECTECRRLTAESRRRDVGFDNDEDEFADFDELFRREPLTAAEAELILAGGEG